MLTFSEYQFTNFQRFAAWDGLVDGMTSADVGNALAGEVGELCNIVKKLRRIELGLPGNKPGTTQASLVDELGKEVGDVIAYLMIISSLYGIDVGKASASKFNEVSDRVNLPFKLPV